MLSNQQPVRLHSLTPPDLSRGVTWGVPWVRGELGRDDKIKLYTAGGQTCLPLQSWPTAYWPDGSVKWSAHAAVYPQGLTDELYLAKESGSSREDKIPGGTAEEARVSITDGNESVTVDTGVMQCVFPKQGRDLIRSITRQQMEVCSGAQLVCMKQNIHHLSGVRTVREEQYRSKILKLTVEQEGPVRAVIRLAGRFQSLTGPREWLPVTLRFYFYAGMDSIRVVHTFCYDGNPHEDFIQGLGLRFNVPMRGDLFNRHVRLAGDTGFFADSPKSLYNRRTRGKYRDLYTEQLNGKTIGFDPAEDAYYLGLLEDGATWDSFKLFQASAGYYRISKRTKEGCSWVKGAEGRRSGGLGYVGSAGGGLAVGLKDFWRKHPSGLEINGTATDEAALTVWFWSPEAEAMDLRHYDTKTHVESAYEGAEEMRATPYGVANTHELTVWCTAETPDSGLLDRMAAACAETPLLVCDPAHYHEAGAFGVWSLPDRSTEAKAYLEDRLDGIIAFYQKEVEQRSWYGFWDYGDFMHSYDPSRHVWNYDLGGCAWQNSELVPNMWLWIMFLRSGRPDIFKLAEAMTRHTSEVDVYHIGEYAGLGARHNVMHWGCGCKEVRIAMAGLNRYYYYLTADERLGDVMEMVKDADYTTVTLDPMRAYFPKDEHPAHIRVGPDWAAFSSNWMTRWERFEDTGYLEKIKTGIQCFKEAKYRLISGPVYGYDPKTNIMTPMGEDNAGRHLAICMGGPQTWFELSGMLEDPEWDEMMADLGVYYNKTQEDKDLITAGEISNGSFEHPVLSVGICAYGAYYHKDKTTADKCWSILFGNPFGKVNLERQAREVTYVDALTEIDWMNTNEASQWSLNTIISLELIAGYLPEQLPESLRPYAQSGV